MHHKGAVNRRIAGTESEGSGYRALGEIGPALRQLRLFGAPNATASCAAIPSAPNLCEPFRNRIEPRSGGVSFRAIQVVKVVRSTPRVNQS